MSGAVPAKFRWGLIGAGHIASTQFAPAVHASDECVVHAVAARDPERARALEPAGRVYDDYAALCADDEVDAIYISLHNTAHIDWILHAVGAGKHVLCEKPLCMTEADTARAFAAAEAADRILVEAFWYRWHPRVRRAEELIGSGALGEITRLDTRFHFGGLERDNIRLSPQLGGGALKDVGCYTVSAARWALGQLTVESASARLSDDGVDLQSDADLAGETGTARISCSIDSTFADELRIQGTDGALTFGDDKSYTAKRHDAVSLRIADAAGAERVESFEAADAFRLMAEAFARRVRGEDAFFVTREDSLEIAHTLDDIREQSRRPG